mmetsp:Transcript_127209/g.407079  ORF Transcript_127209/g.407079 Transcript_127209/m.407079 type:complete len:405 (-) Transcript_127209:715-1929(-)
MLPLFFLRPTRIQRLRTAILADLHAHRRGRHRPRRCELHVVGVQGEDRDAVVVLTVRPSLHCTRQVDLQVARLHFLHGIEQGAVDLVEGDAVAAEFFVGRRCGPRHDQPMQLDTAPGIHDVDAELREGDLATKGDLVDAKTDDVVKPHENLGPRGGDGHNSGPVIGFLAQVQLPHHQPLVVVRALLEPDHRVLADDGRARTRRHARRRRRVRRAIAAPTGATGRDQHVALRVPVLAVVPGPMLGTDLGLVDRGIPEHRVLVGGPIVASPLAMALLLLLLDLLLHLVLSMAPPNMLPTHGCVLTSPLLRGLRTIAAQAGPRLVADVCLPLRHVFLFLLALVQVLLRPRIGRGRGRRGRLRRGGRAVAADGPQHRDLEALMIANLAQHLQRAACLVVDPHDDVAGL